MSKVQLQGNASGTGIFTIASPNSNTDRTLTLPDNTGTLLTNASTAGFPAGSVLQVVNAVNTTSYSGTLGAETALFNFSITPTSASSKIAVFVSLSVALTGTFNNYAASIILKRGSTTSGTLIDYARFGQYQGGGGTNRELFTTLFFNGLDSPATTSSQPYCITIQNIDGGATYAVNSSGQSNIILMEIAA